MIRCCFGVVGFALFVVFGSAFSDAGEIRGTRWGMTPDEVKAVEDWEYIAQTENHLYFSGELKPGVKTTLEYKFHDGLLVSLSYKLDNSKETYRFFRPILSEKYGRPYERRTEMQAMMQEIEFQKAGVVNASDFTDFLYMRWKIHGEYYKKTKYYYKEKTHLELYYTKTGGVGIIYENLEYRKQRQQLEQDKKRNAIYNLEKSDDL